ncbi:MAG: hypothetical protein WBF33_18960 [Candidatus Nitrosopolaris sp.]
MPTHIAKYKEPHSWSIESAELEDEDRFLAKRKAITPSIRKDIVLEGDRY